MGGCPAHQTRPLKWVDFMVCDSDLHQAIKSNGWGKEIAPTRFQGHVLGSLVVLTGGLGLRGALCCCLLAPHVPRMLPRLPCSLVHTVDTTRTTWTLEQMVKIKQPVLLVGESGTSKTATTQNFLKNLNEEINVSHCLFSLRDLRLCDRGRRREPYTRISPFLRVGNLGGALRGGSGSGSLLSSLGSSWLGL